MIRAVTGLFPPLGWVVLAAAAALSCVGVAAIYVGEIDEVATPARAVRQAMFLGAGLLALMVVQIVGYRRLCNWAYPFYGIILILLALLVLAQYVSLEPFIHARRRAFRWIVLGPLSIQVSDLAKIVLVLAMAMYLRFRTSYRRFLGLVPPFVLTLIPVALILKEPDLGTSLLLPPTCLVMLFAAGAKLRHLLVIVGLGLAAVPAFYFSPLMTDYQKQRIQVLFRQNDDDRRWRMNAGYQLHRSKIALGSGQVFGRGLRQGAFFRHDLLPEEHNDFIFAVIGHQTGFVGCVVVLGCYAVIVVTGLTIATMTTDPVGRLVAVGVCAMLSIQTVINVGMTMGLMPITGMSLPFVSSGGSGLVTNYMAVGLLISVARRRPVDIAPRPFEFDGADEDE